MSGARSLASAFLMRAMLDAHGYLGHVGTSNRAEHMQSAQAILGEPSDDLQFWCDVAEVDMGQFLEAFRKNGRAYARSVSRDRGVGRAKSRGVPVADEAHPVGARED